MKKEFTGQLGKVNPWAYDGEIFNYRISYEDIKEMLKDDAVKSALKFLVLISLNFIGEYKNENEEIENFIRSNFEDLSDNLLFIFEDALFDRYSYGFSVNEIVWEIKENKFCISKIVKLDPDTLFIEVKDDKIINFQQLTKDGKISIPAEKCFYIKNGNGYYGKSELEDITKWFRFKKYMIRYWILGAEKFSVPPLTGKTTGDKNNFLNALTSLYSNGAIAIGKDDEINLLELRNNFNFRDAIDFANVSIYRSLLLPQLLASVGQTGAYELGKIHFEMFLEVAKKTAKFITNKFIDSTVSKMIDYNYSKVDSYGYFQIKKQLSSDDMEKYSRIFLNLTNSGVIDPIEDNDMVREIMEIPKSK